jgi:hypothetical protein
MEGRWKGIRLKRRNAPVQIYDLDADPGEQANIADAHPEIVARALALFKDARTDSPLWPIQEAVSKKP